MKCVFCREKIAVGVGDKIGRNDTCPRCNRDLRCCKQCKFYATDAYNECREVSAERITEKERSNFCDYFVPIGSNRKKVNRTLDARKALDALFAK